MNNIQEISAVPSEITGNPEQGGCEIGAEHTLLGDQSADTQDRAPADESGRNSGVDGPEIPSEMEGADAAEEQSTTGAIEPKHGSTRKPKQKRPPEMQLAWMEIGRIYAEHPMARNIHQEFGVRLRELPVNTISETGLALLAHHSPLHVLETPDKVFCVGSLRLFRLLKYGLPAETVIPVLIHTRLTGQELRNHILFELYVVPVIASLNSQDRKSMGTIWDKPLSKELLCGALRCQPSDALKLLFQCDPRTIRKGDGQ
jgi:hypothetical protein